MKRFYCVICKKVKRVRRPPTLLKESYVLNPDGDRQVVHPDVKQRRGECFWHRSVRETRRGQ